MILPELGKVIIEKSGSRKQSREKPLLGRRSLFFKNLRPQQPRRIQPAYKFHRWEEQYCAAAEEVAVRASEIVKQIDRLETIYQRVVSWAARLEKEGGPPHSVLGFLLADYVAMFSLIHEKNKGWLTVYADALWKREGLSPSEGKVNSRRREELAAAAIQWWQQLGNEGETAGDHPAIVSLRQFPAKQDSPDILGEECDRASLDRVGDKKFLAMVQQVLTATLNNGRYELRHLFEWRSFCALASADIEAGKDAIDERGRPLPGYPEIIRDWVYGYTNLVKEQEERLLAQWQNTAGRELRSRTIRLQRKIFVKWGGRLAVAVALVFSLMYSDIDDRICQAVLDRAQSFWTALFSQTREASEQQNYFREEILSLEQKYTRAEVEARAVDFIDQEAFRKPDRYLTFSREILRGFFLLLALGEADSSLTELVLETSQLLDPHFRPLLQELVTLYNAPVIKESLLREAMLKFRRHLIHHYVFPFMFLVADSDAPFIFLFPEPIKAYLYTEPSDIDDLGLSPSVMHALESVPQIVYFVPGTQYPFKKAAGYFEGEVAIVFLSLSPHAMWTAWHELGHIVDNTRLAFGEKLSRNVELNAMVFPLLFDENRKEYLTGHLLNTVKRAQVNDYYVQAAKGIINGVLIYRAEADPNNSAQLLTDRFEPDRIEAARAVFEKMTSAEIREMAYVLYRNPQKYLSTAKKGRYQAVKTNVDELMYGAHISPEQDVITTGLLGGMGKGRSRLLRDKNNGNDNSGGIRWAALFDALMVFLVFEGLMVAIHLLGKPIRERKLYGRSPRALLAQMLAGHPWVSQRSQEGPLGLQTVLRPVFAESSEISSATRRDIEAFRQTASRREGLLLHVGLHLAPFPPRAAEITNEFHRLLFFIPFFGPYLARAEWLWSRQKIFAERERYNRTLVDLATSLGSGTALKSAFESLLALKAHYEKEEPLILPSGKRNPAPTFAELETLVFSQLERDKNPVHVAKSALTSHGGLFFRRSWDMVEFDRLEVYTEGEDVRDIDWNATARSVTGEAMVRKRLEKYEVKVNFFMEMSSLLDEERRTGWVEDFVKCLKLAQEERRIAGITLFMPDGRLVESSLWDSRVLKARPLAAQVLSKMKEAYEFMRFWQVSQSIPRGLKFYNAEENIRYRQQVQLADMRSFYQGIHLQRLRLEDANVFLVGFSPEERNMLTPLIYRRNIGFYWQGRQAVPLKVRYRPEKSS